MDFHKPQGRNEVTERAKNTQPHDVGVDILLSFFLYRTLTQQSVAIVQARDEGREERKSASMSQETKPSGNPKTGRKDQRCKRATKSPVENCHTGRERKRRRRIHHTKRAKPCRG